MGLLAALPTMPTNLPSHLVEHSINERVNLIPAVPILIDNPLDFPLRNLVHPTRMH